MFLIFSFSIEKRKLYREQEHISRTEETISRTAESRLRTGHNTSRTEGKTSRRGARDKSKRTKCAEHFALRAQLSNIHSVNESRFLLPFFLVTDFASPLWAPTVFVKQLSLSLLQLFSLRKSRFPLLPLPFPLRNCRFRAGTAASVA